MLWSQPEQRAEIARLISKLANPTNAKATELKDRATAVWDEARGKLKAHADEEGATVRAQIALEALTKIKRIGRDLDKLTEQAREQGRNTARVAQAQAAVEKIKAEIIESSDF